VLSTAPIHNEGQMLSKIGKLYSEVFLYKGAYSLSFLARIALIVAMLVNLITLILRKGLLGVTATGAVVGAFEITEVAMIFMVTCAGAWTWYNAGHIRIGIIPDRLKERPRAILTACSVFLAIFYLSMVVWGVFLTAQSYLHFNVTSPIMRFPLGPLAIIFSLVMAHVVLVFLRSFVGQVSKALGKQFAQESYLKEK